MREVSLSASLYLHPRGASGKVPIVAGRLVTGVGFETSAADMLATHPDIPVDVVAILPLMVTLCSSDSYIHTF